MSQLSLIETNANPRLLTYVGGGWAHETRVRVEDKFWCLVCSAVYPYCAEEKSKGGAKSTLIIFGGRNWGPRGSREACTKEADWILGRRVASIQEPPGLCFQKRQWCGYPPTFWFCLSPWEFTHHHKTFTSANPCTSRRISPFILRPPNLILSDIDPHQLKEVQKAWIYIMQY
jgi:hypothetical protein